MISAAFYILLSAFSLSISLTLPAFFPHYACSLLTSPSLCMLSPSLLPLFHFTSIHLPHFAFSRTPFLFTSHLPLSLFFTSLHLPPSFSLPYPPLLSFCVISPFSLLPRIIQSACQFSSHSFLSLLLSFLSPPFLPFSCSCSPLCTSFQCSQ